MITLPNRKALPALLALVALTMSVAACKDFFVDPKLTSITITPTSQTVVVSKTQQLTATGTYDDSSTKTLSGTSVSWTSSDSTSATVDANGLVTALSTNGAATENVTITAQVGTIPGTRTIIVSNATITGLSITPNPLPITNGSTGNLTATATFASGPPANVSSSATWSDDAATVATLTPAAGPPASELVTSVGTGTTTVTAKFGGFTATATVNVN